MNMNIVRSSVCEQYGIIPVKTYGARFWRNVYEIRFGDIGFCAFLVNAANEQDALDELMDYLEETGTYPGYISEWNDENLEELRKDAKEQGYDEETFVNDFYVGPIGNHGLYLHDPYQSLTIEKLVI